MRAFYPHCTWMKHCNTIWIWDSLRSILSVRDFGGSSYLEAQQNVYMTYHHNTHLDNVIECRSHGASHLQY
jgi:hypothetical protein